MPRHRKPKAPAPVASPAPVLVVCRSSFHHGSEEWQRLGYHLVGELRAVPGPDGGPGRLEWTGTVPEGGPLRTPGIKIAVELAPGSPPVKRYRHGDAPAPWRFRCSCGLDVQRHEPDLAAIVARWASAFPGRPCEIDITRLRG